ncbi:DDE superfamily endonuclease [Popillia japonica]|uniref:DDE superfamily endonuclease n=1 Tax=Popillia japonica TaxID=7064 RepID=A0AAW1LQR3_POPJA
MIKPTIISKIKPTIISKPAELKPLKLLEESNLPVFLMKNKSIWARWMVLLKNKSIWARWMVLLQCLQQHFIPEVTKYLSSKDMPFKVLLILDNVPRYLDCNEFQIDSVEILYMPQKVASRIQPLDQGIIKSFKANCIRCLMKYILATVQADTTTRNVVEICENYNICDAMDIIKSALKNIDQGTIVSYWRHLLAQYINETNHVPTESIEDVNKDLVEIMKNIHGQFYNDVSVAEIEELINGKAYELTEDGLFNLTIPEVDQTSDEEDTEQDGHKVIFKENRIQEQVSVSDGGKLEERFTSDNIAKDLRKFKSAMSYFLHIDPSVERSLHVKGLTA